MGNTWQYTVQLDRVTPTTVAAALEVAGSAGYGPLDAATGWVVERMDFETYDIHAHRFDELAAAAAFLAERVGMIDLWRRVAEPSEDSSGFFDLGLTVDPLAGSLSVWAGCDLRWPVWRARAPDYETVFIGLCRALRPEFGYEHDEDHVEDLLVPHTAGDPGGTFQEGWAEFDRSVAAGGPPSILFRLNFFSSAAFERLGRWRLHDLAHWTVEVPGAGVLVYLAPHPWSPFRLAVLDRNGRYSDTRLAW